METAAEINKAVWLGARLTNGTEVGAWEAIAGEFLAGAEPALVEQTIRASKSDQTWWSYNVLSRADWRCEECGKVTGLDAHHILSRAQRPDLKLDLDNGRALCRHCHQGEHGQK